MAEDEIDKEDSPEKESLAPHDQYFSAVLDLMEDEKELNCPELTEVILRRNEKYCNGVNKRGEVSERIDPLLGTGTEVFINTLSNTIRTPRLGGNGDAEPPSASAQETEQPYSDADTGRPSPAIDVTKLVGKRHQREREQASKLEERLADLDRREEEIRSTLGRDPGQVLENARRVSPEHLKLAEFIGEKYADLSKNVSDAHYRRMSYEAFDQDYAQANYYLFEAMMRWETEDEEQDLTEEHIKKTVGILRDHPAMLSPFGIEFLTHIVQDIPELEAIVSEQAHSIESETRLIANNDVEALEEFSEGNEDMMNHISNHIYERLGPAYIFDFWYVLKAPIFALAESKTYHTNIEEDLSNIAKVIVEAKEHLYIIQDHKNTPLTEEDKKKLEEEVEKNIKFYIQYAARRAERAMESRVVQPTHELEGIVDAPDATDKEMQLREQLRLIRDEVSDPKSFNLKLRRLLYEKFEDARDNLFGFKGSDEELEEKIRKYGEKLQKVGKDTTRLAGVLGVGAGATLASPLVTGSAGTADYAIGMFIEFGVLSGAFAALGYYLRTKGLEVLQNMAGWKEAFRMPKKERERAERLKTIPRKPFLSPIAAYTFAAATNLVILSGLYYEAKDMLPDDTRPAATSVDTAGSKDTPDTAQETERKFSHSDMVSYGNRRTHRMEQRKGDAEEFLADLPNVKKNSDDLTQTIIRLFEESAGKMLDDFMPMEIRVPGFIGDEEGFKQGKKILKGEEGMDPVTKYAYRYAADRDMMRAVLLTLGYMKEKGHLNRLTGGPISTSSKSDRKYVWDLLVNNNPSENMSGTEQIDRFLKSISRDLNIPKKTMLYGEILGLNGKDPESDTLLSLMMLYDSGYGLRENRRTEHVPRSKEKEMDFKEILKQTFCENYWEGTLLYKEGHSKHCPIPEDVQLFVETTLAFYQLIPGYDSANKATAEKGKGKTKSKKKKDRKAAKTDTGLPGLLKNQAQESPGSGYGRGSDRLINPYDQKRSVDIRIDIGDNQMKTPGAEYGRKNPYGKGFHNKNNPYNRRVPTRTGK
jgi:hypothetical protein